MPRHPAKGGTKGNQQDGAHRITSVDTATATPQARAHRGRLPAKVAGAVAITSAPNTLLAMSSFPPSSPAAPQPVLLFDGECGLCQRIVRLLLRCDTAGRLHYAALQSAPAQAYLLAQGLPTEDFDSLVFVPDWSRPVRGEFSLRSAGALAAAQAVGGPLRWLGWLRWIPGNLRDAAYRLIARLRSRIFGHDQLRPLPNPAWQARFLSRYP